MGQNSASQVGQHSVAEPHNRTSLTDAISQVKSRGCGATHSNVRPIFSESSMETADEVSRIAHLVREHFRTRPLSDRAPSDERSKQNTLGYLDATEHILELLGHERLSRRLAQIRVEVEEDRPERAAALLANM